MGTCSAKVVPDPTVVERPHIVRVDKPPEVSNPAPTEADEKTPHSKRNHEMAAVKRRLAHHSRSRSGSSHSVPVPAATQQQQGVHTPERGHSVQGLSQTSLSAPVSPHTDRVAAHLDPKRSSNSQSLVSRALLRAHPGRDADVPEHPPIGGQDHKTEDGKAMAASPRQSLSVLKRVRSNSRLSLRMSSGKFAGLESLNAGQMQQLTINALSNTQVQVQGSSTGEDFIPRRPHSPTDRDVESTSNLRKGLLRKTLGGSSGFVLPVPSQLNQASTNRVSSSGNAVSPTGGVVSRRLFTNPSNSGSPGPQSPSLPAHPGLSQHTSNLSITSSPLRGPHATGGGLTADNEPLQLPGTAGMTRQPSKQRLQVNPAAPSLTVPQGSSPKRPMESPRAGSSSQQHRPVSASHNSSSSGHLTPTAAQSGAGGQISNSTPSASPQIPTNPGQPQQIPMIVVAPEGASASASPSLAPLTPQSPPLGFLAGSSATGMLSVPQKRGRSPRTLTFTPTAQKEVRNLVATGTIARRLTSKAPLPVTISGGNVIAGQHQLTVPGSDHSPSSAQSNQSGQSSHQTQQTTPTSQQQSQSQAQLPFGHASSLSITGPLAGTQSLNLGGTNLLAFGVHHPMDAKLKIDIGSVNMHDEKLAHLLGPGALSPSPRTKAARGRGKRKALIVDHVAVSQRFTSVALYRAGFHCDVCSDGEAAMKLVRASHYEVIILDLLLPGMSAFDVVRSIRHTEAALGEPAIIAIGVTGTLDAPILAACKNANLSACIEKGAVLSQAVTDVVTMLQTNPNFVVIDSRHGKSQMPRIDADIDVKTAQAAIKNSSLKPGAKEGDVEAQRRYLRMMRHRTT